MNYRVYISNRDEILSGEVNEELYQRAQEYKSFFQENDPNGDGHGIYEVELPAVHPHQERSVHLRVTKDELEFGMYGYEGWEKLFQDYEFENNDTTVLFDRMILYYVYQDTVEEHDFYMSYQEATEQIDERDWDIFDNAIDQYIEEKESEEN